MKIFINRINDRFSFAFNLTFCPFFFTLFYFILLLSSRFTFSLTFFCLLAFYFSFFDKHPPPRAWIEIYVLNLQTRRKCKLRAIFYREAELGFAKLLFPAFNVFKRFRQGGISLIVEAKNNGWRPSKIFISYYKSLLTFFFFLNNFKQRKEKKEI